MGERFDRTPASTGTVAFSMPRLGSEPNYCGAMGFGVRGNAVSPMSILKNVLSVLAEDPVGEMPVDEVKERVI